MEQFASLNPDGIQVVAVGTLDNQELAEDFHASTGLDVARTTWSESRDVWEAYDVGSQHTTILLDSSGNELQRWRSFSPQEVADAVG